MKGSTAARLAVLSTTRHTRLSEKPRYRNSRLKGMMNTGFAGPAFLLNYLTLKGFNAAVDQLQKKREKVPD